MALLPERNQKRISAYLIATLLITSGKSPQALDKELTDYKLVGEIID
jgi:hypothetical protein